MEESAATTSKKGAKKAEAKAKKEALKSHRAAELAAAADNVTLEDDPAAESYGDRRCTASLFSHAAEEVEIRSLNESHIDKTVIVRAWLQNTRVQSAKMGFLELSKTGNWSIQGIVMASDEEPTVSRRMVKWVMGINPESFVAVEAKVKQPLTPIKSCRVEGLELHITKRYLLASAPPMLGMTLAVANQPIVNFSDDKAQVGDVEADKTAVPAASMLTHLDNIAMHKRSLVQQAIAGIRIEVKRLFRSYLEDRGFNEFEPPCLIRAASEGGGNVFRLPYFGDEASLAQSPQFYKQFEIAGGRERVFSTGPVFRAENSNTARHMTEFTGLDIEMEIKDSYTEVRDILEGVLLHIFRGIQATCRRDCGGPIRLPFGTFLPPRAGQRSPSDLRRGTKAFARRRTPEFANVRDDEDMSTPQEKALGEVVRSKFKTDFYVVDKFPETARLFYAKMGDAATPVGGGVRVTNAFDFFARNQEILSGGQRINDAVELEARIRAKGVDPDSAGIKEYLAVFRSVGVPPHGGGGIGLDRVVAWYLGLPSVHLAAYYPRTPKRLTP
ncbi:aspartyl-tRNA synthetase [Cladorrhinum sp. PSN332]|nr:aspartyl-tRNA synthetase [Cladorrhinum sp. PSN332]